MLRRLYVLVLAGLFFLPVFSNAGTRIESWKNNGLVFEVRDDLGKFVKWGKLEMESWDDGTEQSSWVVRHEDGTFTTGYRGRLELWKTRRGIQREEGENIERLVIRNADGHFVTWSPLEQNITKGWEPTGKKGQAMRYVVRLKEDGKPPRILDWGKGKRVRWKGRRWDVLVVRDTSDGDENGRFLTWMPGTYNQYANGEKWIEYRAPDGRIITKYKLNSKK